MKWHKRAISSWNRQLYSVQFSWQGINFRVHWLLTYKRKWQKLESCRVLKGHVTEEKDVAASSARPFRQRDSLLLCAEVSSYFLTTHFGTSYKSLSNLGWGKFAYFVGDKILRNEEHEKLRKPPPPPKTNKSAFQKVVVIEGLIA